MLAFATYWLDEFVKIFGVIINRQLLSILYIPHCRNDDASVVNFRFCIGLAGMIDIPRGI